MGPCRRAALGGIEGGQALGLDLQKFSRQDSSRNTHALEHGSSQKRVGLPRAGGLTALGAHLYIDVCGDKCLQDLILLSASPDAGARTVEGSVVQSEEDRGLDIW
jgi:hypothetical protein